MVRIIGIIVLLTFSSTTFVTAQQGIKDTVYILFDDANSTMKKVSYKISEKTPRSFGYKIRQQKNRTNMGMFILILDINIIQNSPMLTLEGIHQ